MKKGYKAYTAEAEAFLRESWGEYIPARIVNTINKMLGDNKTFDQIKWKASMMGLGTIKEAYNLITLTDVSQAFQLSTQQMRKNIDLYGLPTKRMCKEIKFVVIDVKIFWKWADKNRGRLNFKKYQKGSLLPEPDWLKYCLKEEGENTFKRWTTKEDSILKAYVNNGKSYAEIAEKLGVGETRVRNRIRYLRKYKKQKLPGKYKKANEIQIEYILARRKKGKSFSQIAKELNMNEETVRLTYHRIIKERGKTGGGDRKCHTGALPKAAK